MGQIDQNGVNTERKYTSSEMYEIFKRARNKIRKHFPMEIILRCIRSCTEIYRAEGDAWVQLLRKSPPWHLFLITKWALLYGDNISPNREHLSDVDFTKLMNIIFEMSGKVRMPVRDYPNPYLYFRNLAFQQFWLQENFVVSRLSRESIMFGHLSESHTFSKWFKEETGIAVGDFIELSVAIITHFMTQENQFVTSRWFESVKNSYPDGSIDSFLNILSKDFQSVRKYLDQIGKQYCDISYEYYEQSPLKRFPLLRSGEEFHCYFIPLLFHSLQTYIYDTLRDKDAAGFMNKFGPLFELYVKKGLEFANLTFFKEQELQSMERCGKVVDFLIVQDGCNIFVDAKGVEMSYLGMVEHRAEVIRDKTKSSILKAIEQGLLTANRVAGTGKIGNVNLGTKENYLLVVTYKDLYIGNGTIFYEIFAKDNFREIIAECGNKLPIPFENMYFMSVDDFDLLVAHLKSHSISLVDLLRTAVAADREPKTSKFVFRQHFSLQDTNGVPDYLIVEFEQIADRCSSKIR